MSIIINKQKYEIPDLKTKSWEDNISWVKYITDKSPRIKSIKNIILHTHEGIVSQLLQGIGPDSKIDEALARYQVNTERQVSWDYTVDLNGEVVCQNDPVQHYSWQAGQFNPSSLGIEIIQENKNGTRYLYEEELKKTVLLVDFLTAALGIQRQIAWKAGKPVLTQIQRVIDNNNFIGLLGHVNLTRDRGRGDPGEQIFIALKDAGYECFDVGSSQDITAWKQRQKDLGIENCDGIPGKQTVGLLKSKGYKNGIWIQRPIDGLFSF
jgi:hypothetical protein